MKPAPKTQWFDTPEAHDYPAALSYLSLLLPVEECTRTVERLKAEQVQSFKAKDIFRASGLSLLGISNSHVQTVRNKIDAGKRLSPLLLVRDPAHGKVIVADGYHRLCAVYGYDEDALIPCQIC